MSGRRRGRVAIAASLLLLASCGRKAERVVFEGPPPPAVLAVVPAPRSTGVSDRPEIRVRFDRPLDPATVDGRSVTLQLDTQYVPLAVTWRADSTQIVARPLVPLRLFRTYTVRLGSALASADGRPLGAPYAWQFRTTGVAPVERSWPADGAVDESPFAALFWSSPNAELGELDYRIWAGADSAAVAARQGGPRATLTATHHLPLDTWGTDRVVYWALTVRNSASRESWDGPVWRFRTLAADVAQHVVTLRLSDWGNVEGGEEQVCNLPSFGLGQARLAALRFDLRPIAGKRLLGATFHIQPNGDALRLIAPHFYATIDDWRACDIVTSGHPQLDPRGTLGTLRASAGAFETSNDMFVSQLEAMARYPGFFGFALNAGSTVTYDAGASAIVVQVADAP